MNFASMPLPVAVGLAFLGGLLSFLSPCVLPLVPAYLGHLAGASVRGSEPPTRLVLVSQALAFVAGFATIFTVTGIAVGAFLESLQAGLQVLRIVGGLAVIALGLHMAGLIRMPLLDRTAKLDSSRIRTGSPAASFLVGVFFAAGWSPCVGSILTGIFSLTLTQTAQAGLLFFVYSLGLGMPFVAAALLLERAVGLLRRLNKHGRTLALVNGAFLVIVGLLLLTDTFALLAALVPPLEPPLNE